MMLKFFKQHTWQALAVTFGGASTWKAGLSAAPTYNTKQCLVHNKPTQLKVWEVSHNLEAPLI